MDAMTGPEKITDILVFLSTRQRKNDALSRKLSLELLSTLGTLTLASGITVIKEKNMLEPGR